MLPIIMFERLLAFFEKGPASAPEHSGASALQRAAAVLLAIAAQLDGHGSPDERESIVRLLRVRLGVEDAEALVDEADEAALASTDFYQVTRVIKDRLEADQRAGIIEMLWEVVYADGEGARLRGQSDPPGCRPVAGRGSRRRRSTQAGERAARDPVSSELPVTKRTNGDQG